MISSLVSGVGTTISIFVILALYLSLFFIILMPHFVFIAYTLAEAWVRATSAETHVTGQNRWSLYGSELRIYLTSWVFGLITVAFILGGGYWVYRVSLPDRSVVDTILWALWMATALLSMLAVASTAFAGLLPRMKGRASSGLTAIITTALLLAAHAVAFAYPASYFLEPLWRANHLAWVKWSAGFVALAVPLIACALLWRRWVNQGDAWFRIREE